MTLLIYAYSKNTTAKSWKNYLKELDYGATKDLTEWKSENSRYSPFSVLFHYFNANDHFITNFTFTLFFNDWLLFHGLCVDMDYDCKYKTNFNFLPIREFEWFLSFRSLIWMSKLLNYIWQKNNNVYLILLYQSNKVPVINKICVMIR